MPNFGNRDPFINNTRNEPDLGIRPIFFNDNKAQLHSNYPPNKKNWEKIFRFSCDTIFPLKIPDYCLIKTRYLGSATI